MREACVPPSPSPCSPRIPGTAPTARMITIVMIHLFLAAFPLCSRLSADEHGSPQSLTTRAEATEFRETTTYEEVISFIRQLDRESPYVTVDRFGETEQGRPLFVVILSGEGAFDPTSAALSGKPVVLISNGIHSGEICGKEASLMLMRDIVRGDMRHLLEKMTLLVVPVFNVDGHERVSTYNRLNQNGPEGGMGFRANALGLDLNRDFMKLETAETRSWVEDLFTRWLPHLTIDTHTTDGYDHRYAITYIINHRHPTLPVVLHDTMTEMIEDVAPRMREAGYPMKRYGSFTDKARPELGFKIWPPFPRLCSDYVPVQGRLCLLSEAHAHKDFRTRVLATHTLLRTVLGYVASHPDRILTTVKEASRELDGPGREPGESGSIALELTTVASGRHITLEGWEFEVRRDDRTGMDILTYTRTPRDYTVPLIDSLVVTNAVRRPAAYVVPREYRRIAVDLLLRHGVRVERALESFEAEVEVYHISNLSFDDVMYQGHFRAEAKVSAPVIETRSFPEGTFIVPMDQRPCYVAALILEPESPDGLIAWNRMNAITVDPKIHEEWVMARHASLMMNDPETAAAFEERAASDPGFFEDDEAKTEFFWERSLYATPGVGDYPITRLSRMPDVATEPVERPGRHAH